MLNTYLAIAFGGALGAVSRYWLSTAVERFNGSGFPMGTFTVNLLGSFLIGMLFILFAEKLSLVEQWRPGAVAHSQPSGIHWPVPALELLDAALIQWSNGHLLRLYAYTTQEVRVAITGHPNTSKDELAYEVIVSLGLIGQAKTAHEWEAIAAGHYHLSRE